MPAIMVPLNPGQKDTLERAGIYPQPYEHGGKPMFIVPEQDVQRALDLLDRQTGRFRNSGLEDIVLAELLPRNGAAEAPNAPAQCGRAGARGVNIVDIRLEGPNVDHNRQGLDPLSRVAQEVLSPLGRSVVIHPVGGKRSPPLNDGAFHIHLFASPSGERRYAPPARMFGIPVTSNMKSYRPSGGGINIMADDSDWVAAELVNDNLYVHHDVMEGSNEDAQIFRRILQETLRQLPNVPASEELRTAQAAAQTGRGKARQAYITACSSRMGDTVTELEGRLAELRREVDELRVQLVKSQRAAIDAQARLDGVRTGNSDILERFGHEFDTLINHPKVTDVRVEGEVVKVFTTVLNCRHPQTKELHEIGAFRIEIHAGRPGYVLWKNLTRSVDGGRHGMQAPHIDSQGRACLGNTADSFAQLIADYEFAQAAFLAIEFVESVNIGDAWGQHLSKWPLAKEQDKE